MQLQRVNPLVQFIVVYSVKEACCTPFRLTPMNPVIVFSAVLAKTTLQLKKEDSKTSLDTSRKQAINYCIIHTKRTSIPWIVKKPSNRSPCTRI